MCAESLESDSPALALASRILSRSAVSLVEIPVEITSNGLSGWRADLYGRTLELSLTEITGVADSIRWALHSFAGSTKLPTPNSLCSYAESMGLSLDATIITLYSTATILAQLVSFAGGESASAMRDWEESLEIEPPPSTAQNMQSRKIDTPPISTEPLGPPAVTQPAPPRGKRAGSSTKRGKKKPAARKKTKRKSSRKAGRSKG